MSFCKVDLLQYIQQQCGDAAGGWQLWTQYLFSTPLVKQQIQQKLSLSELRPLMKKRPHYY